MYKTSILVPSQIADSKVDKNLGVFGKVSFSECAGHPDLVPAVRRAQDTVREFQLDCWLFFCLLLAGLKATSIPPVYIKQ